MNIVDIGEKRESMIPFKTDNGYYGYIDEWGKVVIEPKFLYVSYFDSDGLAVVKSSSNIYYLIDNKGNYVKTFGSNIFINEYKDGYRVIRKETDSFLFAGSSKTTYGLLDKDLKIVLNPKYDEVDYLGNGWCIYKKKDIYYVTNIENHMVSYFYVSKPDVDIVNNIVKLKGEGGVIYYKYNKDKNGMDIIMFDSAKCMVHEIENEKYKNHSKLGLCVVNYSDIDNIHAYVCDINGKIIMRPNLEGLSDQKKNHYYMSSTDTEFFSLMYQSGSLRYPLIPNKYGLVDYKGEVIIKPEYSEPIKITKNHLIGKYIKDNDRLFIDENYYKKQIINYHIYDYKGKLIFEIECDNLRVEEDNDLEDDIFIVEEGNKEYYIDLVGCPLFTDSDNKIILFDKCTFPKDNYFIVQNTDYDYSMNNMIPYKKYSVLDRKGNMIFSYPNNSNDKLYELRYDDINKVFIGDNGDEIFFFDNKGNIINRVEGRIKTNIDGFYIIRNNIYDGLYDKYGNGVIPCITFRITRIASNTFDIIYDGKHNILYTNNDYNGDVKLDNFSYFYNHNNCGNMENMINRNSDFVLINYNYGNEIDCYTLINKKYLKAKIGYEELEKMITYGKNLEQKEQIKFFSVFGFLEFENSNNTDKEIIDDNNYKRRIKKYE